jgi:hypothetical protein
MPGSYPPDAVCCIEPGGRDCLNPVAHSASVPESAGLRTFFLCAEHWPDFEKAFREVADQHGMGLAENFERIQVRTEFLKGIGEEALLRKLTGRLAAKEVGPEWFAEAFGIVCSMEGVTRVESQPKAVRFLFLKYARDPQILEPRSSDWWYNLATDAAMLAHGLFDLDAALGDDA